MVLAEDLRQAVLQAALQGKLTKQLETDSDVEEILKNIQEDKESKISKGIVKKDKRLFMSIIEEENVPFSIPTNWRWTTLGSIVYKLTDGTHSTPKYTSDGIKFISVKDISTGKLNLSETKYISQEEHNELYKRCNPEKGDMLLSKIGTTGVPAIVDTDEQFSLFVSVALLKYCHQFINQFFLYYILLSSLVQGQAKENTRGVGNKNWVLDFIAKTVIPFPPIEEQQRIVDKINEIMPKIDEYEKIEKELEALKSEFPNNIKDALFQAAMQGKLTEQLENDSSVDELLAVIEKEKKELIAQKKIKKEKPLPDIGEEEIPFDIPENWRWVRWGNLVDSIQYGYNAPAQESGNIKMVRISDIQDNSVNWNSVPYCDISDEEIETYLLKENDILFARTGGTVGKSFLVSYVPKDAIYAGYLIRTRYNAKLIPQYLKLFMESQLYWVQLQNGKTQGCQPNCNGQTLSKMMIPLPPIEEQRRIVERLDALLPLCEDLREV